MFPGWHTRARLGAIILLGGAIVALVSGQPLEATVCLAVLGVCFIVIAAFARDTEEKTEASRPERLPLYSRIRLNYDVRPTGITAPDGTIWLPRHTDGRVDALTGPRGEVVCTVGHLDDGRLGIRAPDGSPLGILEAVAPGAFALVDPEGRTRAWLHEGSGGGEFELHAAGATEVQATVRLRPTVPPRGTVAIDRGVPVWQTLLCVVWVLGRQ